MDNLTDLVIAQIIEDIEVGDFTAIEELLKNVPTKYLIGFLSETVEGKGY